MRRQVISSWRACITGGAASRPRIPAIESVGRRHVRLYALPGSASPASEELDLNPSESRSPDARFEVLGAPSSLLSVQLSPSQNLYTRRGTLVAVSGKAENAVSTLSLLSPLTRLPLGIPFLYQRISSASPLHALISAKSSLTSFAILHLDGRVDWMVAQRNALLAWSGHNLTLKPRLNSRLSLQHWGNTFISGRGLVALVGKGQIYQITLKEGEEYVAHPGNVVAYTTNPWPPAPYRFRSNALRFQIPALGGTLPDIPFFREMRRSPLWKRLAAILFTLRTWARRSIFGDRLFLQFRGPTTILLQSRGSRIVDALSSAEVNEIADAPAGVAQEAVLVDLTAAEKGMSSATTSQVADRESKVVEAKPATMTFATVRGGKVAFRK